MKNGEVIIVKPKGKPEDIMDAIILSCMISKFIEQIKELEEEFGRLIEK